MTGPQGPALGPGCEHVLGTSQQASQRGRYSSQSVLLGFATVVSSLFSCCLLFRHPKANHKMIGFVGNTKEFPAYGNSIPEKALKAQHVLHQRAGKGSVSLSRGLFK